MPCAFQAERPRPFRDLDPGCQFQVPEEKLIEIPGHTGSYCEFHTPPHSPTESLHGKGGWDDSSTEEFKQRIHSWIEEAKEQGKTCDLTGVIFPGVVDFSEKEFPTVCFFRAHFLGGVDFSGARFSGKNADFSNVVFSGKIASFSKARFSGGDTDFARAKFQAESISFSEAQFTGGNADFQGVNFGGKDKVNFCQVKFSKKADFQNGHFNSFANFEMAKFIEDASFIGVQFQNGASFSRAKFSGDHSDFRRVQFIGGAIFFLGAEFSDGHAYFSGARFRSEVTLFNRAKFGGLADFSSHTPLRDANPESSNAFRQCDFTGARFGGDAVFRNRQFLESTSFRNCTFRRAPNFHNCALHQETYFTYANFDDRESTNAAQHYRTLKLAMENVRSRQEEAMFHGLEMESRRNQEKKFSPAWWTSTIYKVIADYGNSFLKPLAWLGVTFFSFILFYMVLIRYFAVSPDPDGIMKYSFRLAFEHLTLPFRALLNLEPEKVEKVIPVKHMVLEGRLSLLRILGAVQSILGVSFLALFLVALRRKFRMG